jgi:hypothetical protein
MAYVAIHHNPFYMDQNVERFEPVVGQSIRAFLDDHNITEFYQPTVCLVNGEPVLRSEWDTTLIDKDACVSFISLPQGGGGGKIFRAVLSIAVMVAAPYVGAAVASSLNVTSALGTALITAGVGLAGSTLVNALVPPPSPSSNLNSYNTTIPSPTYSLQAQGNQARLGEPIPVIYGRHIIYPDFAATPYAEYINNDQFLYQLHVIGQGHYDFEAIRIEDTPITSFDEITYEVIAPGEEVTLFDEDVVTAPEVAGQELMNPDEWVGPFIVNPPETTTSNLSIDVVLPKGLYYANDSGGLSNRGASWEFEARAIDDEGEALGQWFVLGSESLVDNTNTAIRNTYHYAVPSGRYEVRGKRLEVKSMSARVGNDVTWQGLKAHLETAPDYGDVTLLALRMKATDNLSQTSSRMVNAIVTRKLKIWDEVNGWSNDPQPTSSIAWVCVDILKSAYGAELSDDRIDLKAFHALDQIWQARGDTFAGVFDTKTTVWDAITQVARCGRAVPFLQGGIVRIIRDEHKTLPVGMFTPRNIIKDSLSIDYVMPGEDTADSITVEYFNHKTWMNDEVTVALPGSATDKPATVTLFGCTNQAQAEREGLYMAAANFYRRRLVNFKTELEGLIPTYGDMIALNHDMPQWGQAGDITSYDHPILHLSEPVTFDENKTHYIGLRRNDGEVSGPWEVRETRNPRQVELITDALDFVPYTDNEAERTHFAFGAGETWAVLARVMSVRPRGDEIEINAVIEHEAVHQADQT